MEIKWLSYVPIYLALCEEKSIAKAAVKLNCSSAHISRQLRQLEALLDTQLIQRTTRQFNLTYDGLAFYKQVKALFAHAESINKQLHVTNSVSGKLRIAASASFGSTLLSEHLADFNLCHPNIELEVVFTETPLDLIEQGFDVAFYFTETPPDGYVGHYIRHLQCKPFAHSSYIARNPAITHPLDLIEHQHIIYRNSEFTLDKWCFINQTTQEKTNIILKPSMSFSLVTVMTEAMIKGCGIAMLDEMALSHLDSDKRTHIINILPDWFTPNRLPLYILYPKRKHLAQRTSLFVNFIRQQFEKIN
ncbi:LysR family transcriptional regulator [Photobacterium leiognathi]|uniref:LysR family transcriptional regulator n=1 Tax=Photobacterium leiognathi TaxID=553611 RepID=UPI00298269E5|nr:LysR substrate-binding domain-containing protein [Photobacterium leiognathi]